MEARIHSRGAGVTGGRELPGGCCELNSDPLQEHKILISESSFQSFSVHKKNQPEPLKRQEYVALHIDGRTHRLSTSLHPGPDNPDPNPAARTKGAKAATKPQG